jgi:hypothetical protein
MSIEFNEIRYWDPLELLDFLRHVDGASGILNFLNIIHFKLGSEIFLV